MATDQVEDQPPKRQASPAQTLVSQHDMESDSSADVATHVQDREEVGLSQVVRGTTENVLSKLEENLGKIPEAVDEKELLQTKEPGPLEKNGKDVEEVLNIISQSIYREGNGRNKCGQVCFLIADVSIDRANLDEAFGSDFVAQCGQPLALRLHYNPGAFFTSEVSPKANSIFKLLHYSFAYL